MRKSFQEEIDEFERDFERAQKWAIAVIVLNALAFIAILGGIAFVVYKVLSHFGIM
jgi:hypothetical protein